MGKDNAVGRRLRLGVRRSKSISCGEDRVIRGSHDSLQTAQTKRGSRKIRTGWARVAPHKWLLFCEEAGKEAASKVSL